MRRLLLLLLCAMAAPSQEPRSWTPEPRALPASLTGSDPQTYETFCQGNASDPVDVGLSWPKPRRLGEFTAEYVTLAGRAYEPAVTGQSLEYWADGRWRPLRPAIHIDYSGQRRFALLEASGTAVWQYRFAPVATERLRLVLTQPANADGWHRCFALRHLNAGPPASPFTRPEVRIAGALPRMPRWLEPGSNLAAPESGARVTTGNPAEVHWDRPVMVNRVITGVRPVRVWWWDGRIWRDAKPAAAGDADLRFLPVATTALRVATAAPCRSIEAFLDNDARRYFDEIERARTDQLGARFRRLAQPDLRGMQGLLLPLDFAKIAIGRPADLHETMVGWNGAVFLQEPEQAGAKNMDRWFAFAAGPDQQPFGADWVRTHSEYVDGYMPAVVTIYRRGAIRFEVRSWVTAPGPEPYGTAMDVTAINQSNAPADALLTIAMGRRPHAPPHATPLSFSPEITGYVLDRDEQTVRTRGGDILLFAQRPGAWEGTPRENHLRYKIPLAAGERRSIRFFAPSVDIPLREVGPLRQFDWAASLRRFREYWRRTLDGGMRIEVPEPRLNAIYRSLLAQALIITLDGDSIVRYGAYSYEAYFGLEEGWPAVALAQYGYGPEAQKILSAMLAPALMDKSNYHHQYRNGLEGWYAATIYRLTHDRVWLAKIAPALQAAADWTIRTIHENRDPQYGGILPRHAYGGDIHTPAYSLYSNATCWRGLNDTAMVMGDAGRQSDAERYRREAGAYRRRLWQLADELADRQAAPPFLPMSFEIGDGAESRKTEPPYSMLGLNAPSADTWRFLGNYWNLFAPSFVELRLFEPGDPRSHWVADYMDARGGVLAGLVRFTLGLDPIYGKGYSENLLARGKRDEFATALYGFFAHAMSRNLYSFPEVAGVFPLRTSNAALWQEYQRNLWEWGLAGWHDCEGEPTSAGPGVALQLLRMALVREDTESDRQDTLRLLDGAPAGWFAPGKRISIRNAPTFFGTVSLDVESAAGQVTARLTREAGFSARETVLRLADPGGRTLRVVSINGRPWREFSGNQVRLPAGEHLAITADF